MRRNSKAECLESMYSTADQNTLFERRQNKSISFEYIWLVIRRIIFVHRLMGLNLMGEANKFGAYKPLFTLGQKNGICLVFISVFFFYFIHSFINK